MLAVITKDGFHTNNGRALALMGISSSRITFGVGGADINQFSSPREAGKEAIRKAIQNAGKEGESPQIILITASPGNEESVLQGIEDVIGKNVPIIGGSSGDNDLSGKWKQFVNNKVYSNGVALTAIFTNLKIGWGYEAGYLRTSRNGTITKAEGRVIYEIDNQPAAEIYNEWTDGVISEKLETGGNILSETTFHPLAKIVQNNGEEHYISIHPLSVNPPNKSLTVFANVEEGDKVMLMYGNWEVLLNRAQSTPHKVMENNNILPGEAYFGVYTFCAGTMLAIPESERNKIPLLISTEIGNVPFIGTFTFGEQGPIGESNYHGNLVNSIILFTEQ